MWYDRALLRQEPRTANVVAKGYCDTLVLEREDFNRLMGPLETILERTVSEPASRCGLPLVPRLVCPVWGLLFGRSLRGLWENGGLP